MFHPVPSISYTSVTLFLPARPRLAVPFAINGSRNSQTAFLVDGADNMDRGSNATLLTTPSIDSIAEFKVLRSGYSAEAEPRRWRPGSVW